MDDLQKLLSTVEALDPDTRAKEEQPPTDEELEEARAGLVEALKDAAGGDRPDLESARAIRAAIDKIAAEVVTRIEAAEAAKKEAAELMEGLEGDKPEVKPPDGDDAEGDDADKDDADPEVEAKTETKKVPVAASLSDAISRSSKRRAAAKVEVPVKVADVLVSALGPAQGNGIAQDAGIDEVASLFNRYAPQVKRGGSVLVHLEREYPENRTLGNSVEENTRTIENVLSPRALTAAGGICEPLPVDFSHPICGDRGRPIFNANPIFRADRGGIRFGPSITVADMEAAITVWDSATDANPGSAVKACPRVDCDTELACTVDAIVACLTVGNFQARFNPEFWRSRLDLLMVAHDRIAEQTLYACIESQATQVTYAGGSGTIVDVLTAIDRAVAGIRSRHRLIGTQFVAIMPSWLQDAFRSNFVGQAPAGSDALFCEANAELSSFFTCRGVTPVWSPDIELFTAQAPGALNNFEATVTVVVYPVGTFITLDGGTLDLGTSIVDSSLNAVNDRQAFMETFEGCCKRGCEALSIDIPVNDDCICVAAGIR